MNFCIELFGAMGMIRNQPIAIANPPEPVPMPPIPEPPVPDSPDPSPIPGPNLPEPPEAPEPPYPRDQITSLAIE